MVEALGLCVLEHMYKLPTVLQRIILLGNVDMYIVYCQHEIELFFNTAGIFIHSKNKFETCCMQEMHLCVKIVINLTFAATSINLNIIDMILHYIFIIYYIFQ